ncbi:CH domain-containing protein [Plasmodium brasilianum]|uniref:Calponin-homology (CH) domain-containing protein n=2 Tax=Plasmodium (Plasmodium) TaxID=418103 RepID=A0A1D3JMQ3_PLAMA|nr:conserved protein, unknown function [Plasmodium malariae]KAI4839529.1 CH domain-containing protein [Plasmodium brasilianum]SBT87948.1 conserved protein, unknown function [Plasmodium malariae]
MNKNELIKIASKIKEEELQELNEWLNSFALSRKIKNVHRDFSDGVLMAELVNICLPKFVELHNYSKANSINQKKYNWNTLNEKVFKRLGFKIDKKNVEEIVNCKYMGVEKVLNTFKNQLQKFQNETKEEENLKALNDDTEKAFGQSEGARADQNQDQLNNMNSDILNNDEIIKILKDKIFNLEKLLKIKDNKIDILNRKIDALSRTTKNYF